MTAVVRDVGAHCPKVSTIEFFISSMELAEVRVTARNKLLKLTPQPKENLVDVVLIPFGDGRPHLITVNIVRTDATDHGVKAAVRNHQAVNLIPMTANYC
jgi:hypothetical protein